MTFPSTKPYLLRAIYEWCVDNGFTPYLQVKVDAATRVPREHIREGQIVLNIGTEATHQLSLGNDEVNFQARFGGSAFPVRVPVGAVVAIYARENGQGMAFEPESSEAPPLPPAPDTAAPSVIEQDATDAPQPSPPAAGRSHLTRIK
ncbi:MAG: ClpXP protease specificity-enhancing factor [Rhodocyclaceae bacterium]|jgi:stringent starvation protein B|nr:ClpXP protease specificity-enhancing factor [Rhodocyclaceae bacterium]